MYFSDAFQPHFGRLRRNGNRIERIFALEVKERNEILCKNDQNHERPSKDERGCYGQKNLGIDSGKVPSTFGSFKRRYFPTAKLFVARECFIMQQFRGECFI